jgi:magnesium transporter
LQIMTRSRVYRDGRLQAEDFPSDQLAGYLDDPEAVVWLDLTQPGADDLAAISEKLGLHALVVQDAVEKHQHPKLSRYQGHALLITYAAQMNARSGALHAHELAVILTDRAMITVRKDDGLDIEDVVERWDAEPELAGCGVSYLLHGVLDHVVDTHMAALQVLDDQIESLEDSVFTGPPTSVQTQRRSLRMHKSLGQLRRKVAPMREVLGSLMRRASAASDERMLPYYQDVLDHVMYSIEQVESLRDLIATIRDTQLNLQGNRMNLVMKKVTSWAAIIAVPTAITGFYGQNVPIPGMDKPFSFWLSTVTIVLASIALYASFKRRDWL